MRNHQRMDLVDLKEGDNHNYLNKKAIMEDATCLKYGKPLVKSNKMEPKRKLVTVLSAKRTILACNEFLAHRPVICHFHIFHDCKINFFLNTNNKLEG